ncbi:MAG: hypothetical protein L0H96_09745 [Humibacillus sp.]|nr:hypothetical protein [Humibacillus sp.]MDN5777182.1 hypothetical protein [Humibacillus sp.]
MLMWVVSFTQPLTVTRLSAGLLLAGLHLTVGNVVIAGLRRLHVPNPDRSTSGRVA